MFNSTHRERSQVLARADHAGALGGSGASTAGGHCLGSAEEQAQFLLEGRDWQLVSLHAGGVKLLAGSSSRHILHQ
ncbi:hypothetical protein HaLaN_28632 [Haematococcus lacustris]|uniref:Uncharacterized protein n=1 Tax=Haematococcus lacustris TaxID=44745 RepID=A0A6A0ADF5_HAELA|nr:hypothetical protein HaLaN_28632 [Haematococcus lacustris]